jgi:hypothetical protein
MPEGREQRREFDSDGYVQLSFYISYNFEHLSLDLGPARLRVAGRVIEVQLERVGACLLMCHACNLLDGRA